MLKQDMKIGDFLDFWLEEIMKGTVRYSTYIAYSGYIKNHINVHMTNLPLCEIGSAHIQELVGKLSKVGRIGPRTIGIIVRMLSNAFSYAEDYELIIKNPCRRIRLPKVEEKELAVFDHAEQTKIEKAILNSKDHRHYAIFLTLYTGLRIGELCALRWENVDFVGKCIHIKKQLNRMSATTEERKTVMCECEPKTRKSKRTVILPDFICKLLKKLKEESRSAYVFSMKNGKFIQPRTMQNLHRKLLKQANVRYNKFHVTRHTFATRAAEVNADPKTVSETLGHSSTTITLNRYTHSLKEQKQKMMRGLNSYFNDKKISTILKNQISEE